MSSDGIVEVAKTKVAAAVGALSSSITQRLNAIRVRVAILYVSFILSFCETSKYTRYESPCTVVVLAVAAPAKKIKSIFE